MLYNPAILFEDDAIVVISKPAGMVVNRADTTETGETLQDWVESKYEVQSTKYEELDPVLRTTYYARSGIAHRLDKETSGVMLLGKTPEALAELMRQFKARETHKEYRALVHGIVEPQENIINLPIKRSVENRHKFKVDVDGKPAITRYSVEQKYDMNTSEPRTSNLVPQTYYQDGFTLLRLFPKTGRTHQIRVHMTHIGHPLVGDELYGGRKRVDRDREWCPRHFLHAASIEFTHPITPQIMKIEAPLPDDLQQALQFLSGH